MLNGSNSSFSTMEYWIRWVLPSETSRPAANHGHLHSEGTLDSAHHAPHDDHSFLRHRPSHHRLLPSSCPTGHYLGNGNGNHEAVCQPVGMGYYSPPNDLDRHPCEARTFSNIETADSCTTCAPGTFAADPASPKCSYCPPGTYSSRTPSSKCNECDPYYYHGYGSDYAILLTPGLSEAPTEALYCVEPLDPFVSQDEDEDGMDGKSSTDLVPPVHHPTPSPTGFATVPPTFARAVIPSTSPTCTTSQDSDADSTPLSSSLTGNHKRVDSLLVALLLLVGLIATLGVWTLIILRKRKQRSTQSSATEKDAAAVGQKKNALSSYEEESQDGTETIATAGASSFASWALTINNRNSRTPMSDDDSAVSLDAEDFREPSSLSSSTTTEADDEFSVTTTTPSNHGNKIGSGSPKQPSVALDLAEGDEMSVHPCVMTILPVSDEIDVV